MSSDQFSGPDDCDKTIILPSPGGRRAAPPGEVPPSSGAPPPRQPVLAPEEIAASLAGMGGDGDNPLAAAAHSLLSLVARLRSLPAHNAVNDLQRRMVAEIQDYENRALGKGADSRDIDVGKFFLCSLSDETILNTPWGNSSGWAHNSLSAHFFKKAVGGEEFFNILGRLKQQPAQNLNLLELAYLCLSLGFQGKYRHVANGLQFVENERQELYLFILRNRGEAVPELSAHWQGLEDLRNPFMRHVPFWVFAGVAALVLMLIYMGFTFAVRSTSGELYDNLFALAEAAKKAPVMQVAKPVEVEEPPPSSLVDRFRTVLAEDIAQNRVVVLDGPVLRIFNSFASGSDQVKDDYRPMLARIAEELRSGSTRITVVGHTDNQKLSFSSRFQSNWHLSQSRAGNVAGLLDEYGSFGGRLTFEGRADKEPIAPNDSRENRALNRRIDIHIR